MNSNRLYGMVRAGLLIALGMLASFLLSHSQGSGSARRAGLAPDGLCTTCPLSNICSSAPLAEVSTGPMVPVLPADPGKQ
jgi:hypothetical protein